MVIKRMETRFPVAYTPGLSTDSSAQKCYRIVADIRRQKSLSIMTGALLC
jgi:hypothetical protein